MIYRKADIIEMLDTSSVAVEKAILRIWSFQTASEKAGKYTQDDNGIGFNANDAEFLTSLAEWIQNSRRPMGRRLTAKQLTHGRKRIKKYWRQLMEFANGNIKV